GVPKLASECDGEAVILGLQIDRGAFRGPTDREEPVAVGKLDELREDDARRAERHVDVPHRAGAAIFGEVKGGGIEPLGDVAGLVDAQKEERNALGAGPLQGGEAMTGLLERNGKAR